jgi:outer membrane protein assembly factor BamB
VVRHRLTRATHPTRRPLWSPVPNTRTNAAAVLALLALAGCGGTSARKPLRAATSGLASPTPSPIGTPTRTSSPGSPGMWTSTADLPVPVTDGTVVAGVTRNNNRVRAVDATTGRALWDVPLPLAAGATPGGALGTEGPVLFAAPGAPLVVSLTATTPGSGLTPGSIGPVATALDPLTGRTLWAAPGPANLLDGAAVLTGTAGVDTAGSTTTALDPVTGRARWTRPGQAVGLDGTVAVLSLGDAGISTVLTGTDTATGRALWSSADWARGAQGSRSTVVATGAGHALVETTRSDLAGDTTSLLVRDLRTGQVVGPEVPQPGNPTALTDTTDGVAVVYEKVPEGASTGPYGLDLRTGNVLWQLTPAQSAKAERVGGGLAWVAGADGYVALDDRTGMPRAQALADYPLLALLGEQVKAGSTGLVATPLPG